MPYASVSSQLTLRKHQLHSEVKKPISRNLKSSKSQIVFAQLLPVSPVTRSPAWFICTAAPFFSSPCSVQLPATHLYNLSLMQSVVPKQWKISYITPVHKVPNPNLKLFRTIGLFLLGLHQYCLELGHMEQEGWLPPTKRASATKINQYYRL